MIPLIEKGIYLIAKESQLDDDNYECGMNKSSISYNKSKTFIIIKLILTSFILGEISFFFDVLFNKILISILKYE